MNDNRKPAPTLAAVLAFLLGEAPLDGLNFGDEAPDRPRYWWRHHLREAVTPARSPALERQLERLRTHGPEIAWEFLPGWTPDMQKAMDAAKAAPEPVERLAGSVATLKPCECRPEQRPGCNYCAGLGKPESYSVHPTRCSCHPETCGCKPWTLKQGAATVTSFQDRDAAVETARRLNRAP